MMKYYILTRGTNQDYAFIGDSPAEHWWTEFEILTDFTYSSAILIADGRNFKIYIGGLPSKRKDKIGTPIRYTIILEGTRAIGGESGNIINKFLTILDLLLKKDENDRKELAEYFDRYYTKDYVDRKLLRNKRQENDISLSNVFNDIPEYYHTQSEDVTKDWFKHIHYLMKNAENGIAAYLNLANIKHIDYLRKKYLKKYSSIAILTLENKLIVEPKADENKRNNICLKAVIAIQLFTIFMLGYIIVFVPIYPVIHSIDIKPDVSRPLNQEKNDKNLILWPDAIKISIRFRNKMDVESIPVLKPSKNLIIKGVMWNKNGDYFSFTILDTHKDLLPSKIEIHNVKSIYGVSIYSLKITINK